MAKTFNILLAFGLLVLSLGLFLPVLADNGSNFLGMMGSSGMMNHMEDDNMNDDHMSMMGGNHEDMMHMMNVDDCDDQNMAQNHEQCEEVVVDHTYEDCELELHEQCYEAES